MSHANAIGILEICADEPVPAFGGAIALNFEGDAPQWVELIPKGPELHGNDGRRWTMKDPAKVVAAFDARGLKLPIDINHAQFLKAPKGEESPASGWIEALEVRDGAIHGRVEWTPSGAAALAKREYRYISPALNHDRHGDVVGLSGAGLVNSPNFNMPALNATTYEGSMKTILAKLGLPETATESDALARIGEMQTSLNSRQPDLAAFVPRADYEIALNGRKQAEATLAARDKAEHEAEVARLIGDAVKSGKIAPASKDFYVSTCASAEGLASFRKFIADAPSLFKDAIIPGAGAGKDSVALNSDQSVVAELMSIDAKALSTFVAPKGA